MCYRSLLCGLHPSRIKSSTTVFLLLFCSLGPLYAVNCLSHIHTQLGPDCTLEVTPSMVLSDPTIDPADVVIEVSYGSGIVINDGVLRMQHIGRDIKVKITCIASDCDGGVCWTKIDLSADIPPVFGPALDTAVYCYDSLLLADPADGSYPFSRRLLASCANSSGPHFVADWIEVRDCGVDADTAKIIYREWYAESKLGTRVVAFDTIAVLRLPAIEVALHCPSSDTSYCDAPEEPFGPYLLVENPPGSGLCDTFYLLSMEAEQVSNGLKCGLNWKVETHDFDTDCGSMTAYDVEIVQNCFSSNTACAADAPPEVTIIGGQRQHATCSFWHMVLDTLGPEVHCVPGKDTLMQGDTVITIISSGSHDCLADLFLPSAVVTDLCNAPKYVKAKVDSTETVVYLPAGGDLWQPESSVALPVRPEPYEVIIEAFDSCHNKGMDTCYILIKDQTRPVAVAHDTLTLSLSGKKVWAFPESFDKNSWDNCSQDLLLFLRRTDWQSFCLGDPCDSLVAIPGTASMLDTVDCAYLSDDEGTAPIEAYYSTYLDWLANDGGYCSQLLSQAWMYDLCRMAEVGCNNVEDYDFRSKFQRAFGIEDLDALVQLGGGWADGVPFGCEDLCSEVTVEMLVMDYWCNWSKTWTEVTIEDKTAPSVLQSLTDTVEISCFAYENDAHYAVDGVAGLLTLEELFALAAGGSASAQDSVDALLGSYQGAWLTAAGTYEDANGNALVNSIEFEDRGICKLDTVEERVRYLDLASEMMREKTDSMVERYRFDTTEIQIRPGYVLSPCSQNLQESRSILFAEDNCGNPVITRNFKFWKECNGIVPVKAPDTLRVSQVIRTVLHCEFGLGLFQVPFDTIVSVASCMDIPAIADTLASGIADPDVTGDAMLIFDEACRDVGINRSDRIKTAQPSFQTLCDQVIYRKWIVADWCTEEQDTVVQRIAFRIMSSPEPRAVVHSEQSALVIKQAYPNPFREQTIVGLDIDQSMEVQLVVSNVEGRTVWRSPKQLEQGEYLLSIGRADLPGPGMYFYQVFLDGMLYQTDKIILLD